MSNGTYIEGFTIGFNEKTKKWNSFYSFSPEWMESYGTKIISWTGGEPWLHNSNNVYNQFYGSDFPSTITIVSNQFPSDTKIYQTISEESTDIWTSSLITRNGQQTNITIGNFTAGAGLSWEEGHGTKENVHHSNIMCDVNSAGGITEGDAIRDSSLIAELILPVGPAQEQNVLYAVNLGFSVSGSPDLLANQ